jgi:pyruvate formate lyase activating enzyme
MAPWLNAINIDLKGPEAFYRDMCGAHLAAVVENIRNLHALGIWVEVTTLVIPSLNDGAESLQNLAETLAAISPDIPWHISAFHPAYHLLDKPRTPAETIRRAREIGQAAGLRHVFVGNLPGEQGESTTCHGCGDSLIERTGYRILKNRVANGGCPECKTPVAGVWHPPGRAD